MKKVSRKTKFRVTFLSLALIIASVVFVSSTFSYVTQILKTKNEIDNLKLTYNEKLSDEDILKLFGKDEYIENTLAKDSTRNTDEALIEIYEKLRPGEPTTLDSSKTLAQSELAVNTDSVFVNNGTSVTAALTNSGTVTNNSLFNVNGGTNSNIINGTNGTLKLTGNFENAATGSINDNIVLINGGKTFTNKGSIDLAGFENDSNGGVLNSKNSAVQTIWVM